MPRIYNITLTEDCLELISTICHEYKDIYRNCAEMVLPVMEFEAALANQTDGAYESDTTYNIKQR